MSASLPNVTRYLEHLPQGIDSHAHCMVKASVYRDALESRGLQAVLSDLPSDVQELVEHPPPVSAWVREVHTNTIMIAIRDAHFDVGATGLREYGEWTRKRNRALLTRQTRRVGALFGKIHVVDFTEQHQQQMPEDRVSIVHSLKHGH